MKKTNTFRSLNLRVREDQHNFLKGLPNASAFVREAIDLGVSYHKQEIMEKCRTELFGERPSVSSHPNVLLIRLPKEVWSDEALQAKLDQGATLEEITAFLHAQVHPFFVQVVQGHTEGDQSPKYGKMWPGTRREAGNPTEKKPEENFKGGK